MDPATMQLFTMLMSQKAMQSGPFGQMMRADAAEGEFTRAERAQKILNQLKAQHNDELAFWKEKGEALDSQFIKDLIARQQKELAPWTKRINAS